MLNDSPCFSTLHPRFPREPDAHFGQSAAIRVEVQTEAFLMEMTCEWQDRGQTCSE